MNSNTSNISPRPRPLSPHLGIYKPLITMVTSISHRITGVALSLGLLMFTLWLVVLAFCPTSYNSFLEFAGSYAGLAILFGFTLAFFYHLCNGIRHLIWDTGRGLDLKTINVTGPLVIAAAVVLTLITWVFFI